METIVASISLQEAPACYEIYVRFLIFNIVDEMSANVKRVH